jgi:hypothetical protein
MEDKVCKYCGKDCGGSKDQICKECKDKDIQDLEKEQRYTPFYDKDDFESKYVKENVFKVAKSCKINGRYLGLKEQNLILDENDILVVIPRVKEYVGGLADMMQEPIKPEELREQEAKGQLQNFNFGMVLISVLLGAMKSGGIKNIEKFLSKQFISTIVQQNGEQKIKGWLDAISGLNAPEVTEFAWYVMQYIKQPNEKQYWAKMVAERFNDVAKQLKKVLK